MQSCQKTLSSASSTDDLVQSLSSTSTAADEFLASADPAVSQHIGMLEAQNMHLHHRAQLLEHLLMNTLQEKEAKMLQYSKPPVLLGRHMLPTASKSAGGFRPPPGLAPPSPKSVCTKSLCTNSFPADTSIRQSGPPDLSAASPQFVSPQFVSSSHRTSFAQQASSGAPALADHGSLDSSSVHPCLDLIHHSSDLCTVVWRIDSVSSKLRTSRGFPLLSPCFALAGLPDLRLMFAPGEEWLELAGTAMSRRQKQRRTKLGASESQTYGTVRVKAGDADAGSGVQFRFQVFLGETRCAAAPGMRCDFSKEVVQSCPLEADWRKHMDGNCLTLRLELSGLTSADASRCHA